MKSLKRVYLNESATYPLISILLVCLNNRKTIERALLSVCELDYPNIEFIVIDGESTDGTLEVLNKFRNRIDLLISEKDHGVYDAMNKGVEKANGEFIYFIGADDIIINSWMNLAERLNHGNTIYYCNAYFPVSNRIYYGKFNRIKLLFRNICQQAIFYPRTVFEKYNFSTKYPYLADYQLNLLLGGDPSFSFKYIDLLVAVFSEKGLSTKNTDTEFMRDRLEIIRKNYSFIFYLIALTGFKVRKWQVKAGI